MSGNYQRQSLELRSPQHGDPDGRLRNLSGSSASQRRRQQRVAQQRQDSWFRHSMPPAINRDFESLEHLTPRASDGLDEHWPPPCRIVSIAVAASRFVGPRITPAST
ncbi:hypothetical protein M5D96_009727 [Drosophila gunungcola]|uniref:Uncharacterized protein n=1 Tax=Drosophila gunungcola TaxID=103775 RepID=A0A9P9YJ41_9MUSC|nr:hypothetical protein M5D96_009727 [Drosophila gunungcola]